MIANKETTEKKCCFYASDFHLEMTLVPYINKKIEENKKVLIITENRLEETVKVLISRMNIKNKKEILDLDWNNKDIEEIDIKENYVIIINGSKSFVENANEEIKKVLGREPKQLVNCYLFDEVKNDMIEITNRHTGVLNNLQKNYWKIKTNSILWG